MAIVNDAVGACELALNFYKALFSQALSWRVRMSARVSVTWVLFWAVVQMPRTCNGTIVSWRLDIIRRTTNTM